MTNIIVTTPSELEGIISRAISLALQGQSPQTELNFIPIEEAALMVNLAKNTLYGMVGRREIPFYKRGKKLYFKPAELREWIGSNKVQSREELEAELNATGSIAMKPKKGGVK